MLSKSVSIFITLQNSAAAVLFLLFFFLDSIFSLKKLTIIGLESKENTTGKNFPNHIRLEFNKFYVVGSPTDQICSGVGSEQLDFRTLPSQRSTNIYLFYLPAKVLLMPKNNEQVDFNCNKPVEVLYLYDQNMYIFPTILQYVF